MATRGQIDGFLFYHQKFLVQLMVPIVLHGLFPQRWSAEEKDMLLTALEAAKDSGQNIFEGPLTPAITTTEREEAWKQLAMRISKGMNDSNCN